MQTKWKASEFYWTGRFNFYQTKLKFTGPNNFQACIIKGLYSGCVQTLMTLVYLGHDSQNSTMSSEHCIWVQSACHYKAVREGKLNKSSRRTLKTYSTFPVHVNWKVTNWQTLKIRHRHPGNLSWTDFFYQADTTVFRKTKFLFFLFKILKI